MVEAPKVAPEPEEQFRRDPEGRTLKLSRFQDDIMLKMGVVVEKADELGIKLRVVPLWVISGRDLPAYLEYVS